MNTRSLIVVGVDGSHDGRRAHEWAVGEGRRTDAAVLAVTVWSWDGLGGPVLANGGPGTPRARAEQVSAREIAAVREESGSSWPLVGRVVEGRPAEVLIEASRTARMLVLGSHGHRRLAQAVLSSTSEDCVRGAICPVVIVPAVEPALVSCHGERPVRPAPPGGGSGPPPSGGSGGTEGSRSVGFLRDRK